MLSYGDSGGASRFFPVFYCKKRSDPLDKMPDGARPDHPTQKSVALMRWLVRLVTPPSGTVLDPFAGSGSTGVAALAEGLRFFGIEREAAYFEIVRARLQGFVCTQPEERGDERF